MINTSERLQVSSKGRDLHKAVSRSLVRATELLEGQAGEDRRPSDARIFLFRKCFGDEASEGSSRTFNEAFLHAAMKFCTSNSRNENLTGCIKVLKSYSNARGASASSFALVRRGLKLLLVDLWREKVVLLPTVFAPGPGFPVHLFKHSLLQWIQKFDPDKSSRNDIDVKTRRLRDYGTRLLFAADWKEPADVSLREVASIQRAQIRYKYGVVSTVIAGQTLPCSLFVAQLQRDFPSEVQFTSDDLAKYSQWCTSGRVTNLSFEDFEPKQKTARRRQAVGKGSLSYQQLPRSREKILAARGNNNHESIVDAFKWLKRRSLEMDWRRLDSPCYPGREHMDVSAFSPIWIRTFRGYLRFRKYKKEFQTNRETFAALNLLADYLFFYLPWWKEVNPQGRVSVPSSPADFHRYIFVSREMPAPIEELPATLLDMISARRPSSDAASGAIHQISRYFEFVGMSFQDDEAVVGQRFSNPIASAFDAPRIQRRHKTAKEIIPNKIHGFLSRYAYAIESVGHNIQQGIIAGRLPRDAQLRCSKSFICAEYGDIPDFTYRGVKVLVQEVPNLFNWFTRKIKSEDRESSWVGVEIPHLTSLRLIISALETAHRLQNLQWLDIESWDSLNATASETEDIFRLRVNTDKELQEPWPTLIADRTRNLLHRERSFQLQCVDGKQFSAVNYEGRENSPFAPIKPLFRSPTSAFPIHDDTYFQTWRDLCISFQWFYEATVGEKHKMYSLHGRKDEKGKVLVRRTANLEQLEFCPISVAMVYQPHSCRATFITSHAPYMTLQERATQVEHSCLKTTAYYEKPSYESMKTRMREVDRVVTSEFESGNSSPNCYVRADLPESALVRGFATDREGTVRSFGFAPPLNIWSTEKPPEGEEALTLLREGPMSRIRFRETHICPVGEECPDDVVRQIGGRKRCGICPLAMTCIDHMTAIAARRNELLERIHYQNRRLSHLKAAGEPVGVLDEAWFEADLDTTELNGWTNREKVLVQLAKLQQKNSEEKGLVLHVDRPEYVKRHLEQVTRACTSREFLVQRLLDSAAYPRLATPELRSSASRLKRELLAGNFELPDQDWTDEFSSIGDVVRLLGMMGKALGLSLNELTQKLDSPLSGSLWHKRPELTNA
jgi:hypothetical protein